MNISDPLQIQAMYQSLDTSYQAGIEEAAPFADKIAQRVPSTARSTRHVWIPSTGKFKKYVNEKDVQRLTARTWVVENEKYEDTIEISEEDVEDDQIGMLAVSARMIGNAAAKWPDDMIVECIQKASSTLAFDGQFFFDTDHPINQDKPELGIYSNLFTGMPLTDANFALALQYITTFKGENGRFIPITPLAMLVDPTNTQNARRILGADVIAVTQGGGAAAVTNINKGEVPAITIPEFGNQPGTWYMLGMLGGLKPFTVQVRKEPKTVALTDEQASNVFWHDKMVWGAKARGAASFTFPYLAMKFTP